MGLFLRHIVHYVSKKEASAYFLKPSSVAQIVSSLHWYW